MSGMGENDQGGAGPYRTTVVVGTPPRNDLAVAGLLLAIGALLCLVVCFALAPRPVTFLAVLLLGVLAIGGMAMSALGLTLAYTGYKEVERSHGRYSGRGWAVLGMLVSLPVMAALMAGTIIWLRARL